MKKLDCKDGGKSNKKFALGKLQEAMAFAKTLEKKAWLIHQYCTFDEPAIGLTLGVLKSPDKHRQVADQVADNIRNMMTSKMVKGNSSNDSIGFRNTVILGLVPTATAKTEPVTVVEE